VPASDQQYFSPSLSWQTVVGALTAVALLSGAQWAVNQTQFYNVEKTAASDRARIEELQGRLDKYVTVREQAQYSDGIKEQLEELRHRTSTMQDQLSLTAGRLAHDPVEQKTFDVVSKAVDDRVTLLQNQITDINRQIAAALIIIDNNAGTLRSRQPTLPP
jgi:chromosome segregation ATPase